MASLSQALGEGTGIPAAMGAIAMNQGKVQGRGVLPPEACIDPVGFLSLIGEFMKADSTSRKNGVLEGFLVERVDEHGNVKRVDL
jgi:saccharopine dehydrogenase (NAD+, L-lysine-forming)